MTKYALITASGIHIGIGIKKPSGVAETILETFMPSESEFSAMSENDTIVWIITNNDRMENICNFLNETGK